MDSGATSMKQRAVITFRSVRTHATGAYMFSERIRMGAIDQITGARIVTRRRLEWADTDAAGHNHFSVAFRWMEEVEHELRRSTGLPTDLTGGIPRVHIEVDYLDRIWFGEEVDITMGVADVGRTSCRFVWAIERVGGKRNLLMQGNHVVVHSPDAQGGAVPWPQRVRTALMGQEPLEQLDR